MTAQQYFDELDAQLTRLSPEERQEATAFYREYAQEAGLMDYEALAERFGSPKALAAQIYAEAAEKTISGETGKPHIGRGFLMALAAVFSLPVALPMLIVPAALLFALLVTVGSLVISLGATLLGLGVTAVTLFVKSFGFLVPFAPVLLLKSLGGALVLGAITIFAVAALYTATRWALRHLTILMTQYAKRRSNHE